MKHDSKDEINNYEEVGVYDPQDIQKKINEQCLQMEPKVRPLLTVVEKNERHFISAEIPGVDLTERPLEQYINALKDGKPNLSGMDTNAIYDLMSIKRNKEITLCATMVFSPYPQAYFPQLCITAIVVPGNEIGDLGGNGERFLDNQRIEGNIADMLNGTIGFVKKNMRTKTIINPESGMRDDRTDYPITAVREAVINALVHRDYSIHTEGMPIQILMFHNRIEIHNPRGLYGRIRVDQLGKVQPDTRNPVLASELEILGLTENRYSGIPTIRKELERYNLIAPKFLDERGSFVVKFYKETKQEIRQLVHENNLVLYCRTPRTRKEICDYLGLISTTYAIQRHIMPLIETGQIKMSIPDKPKSPKQLYDSE